MKCIDYKISILMSVYNEKKKEVELALNSILKQSFKNFEFIIIVDLPGNQEIIELINEYKKNDKRVKVIINEKNEGLANSLNKGLAVASGEYIARMDADDIAEKDRLKIQLDYLEERKNEIFLVGSSGIKINEQNVEIGKVIVPIGSSKIKKTLKYRCCLLYPSIMFDKKILDRVKGYRNFPCAQDYDFYLRIMDAGYKIENIDKPLMRYRVRENAISVKKRLFQILLAEYIQRLAKERKQNNGEDSFSEKNIVEIEKIYKKENLKFEKINALVLRNKNNKIKLSFILPLVYFSSKYYRKEIHNRIKIFLSTFLFK